MSMDYIRRTYGVPAKRGGRVEYTGYGQPRQGVILGASGPHLRVRLDGDRATLSMHPTWELRYIDSPTQAAQEIVDA